MIQWINNRYGTNYSNADLDEIKNFTLLWNIYENTIFNARFSVNRLESEISNRNPDIRLFQNCFDYFQSRYVENNLVNGRFHNLNFRKNDREQFVKNVLFEIIPGDNEKICAIGIIIYRLRNNLFHGVKDYRNLNGQVENFTYANLYIQRFLELY